MIEKIKNNKKEIKNKFKLIIIKMKYNKTIAKFWNFIHGIYFLIPVFFQNLNI